MNVSAHLIETILSRWSDRTLIESPDSSLSFSRFFEKASLLSDKLKRNREIGFSEVRIRKA